jgi:hypothetical protein
MQMPFDHGQPIVAEFPIAAGHDRTGMGTAMKPEVDTYDWRRDAYLSWLYACAGQCPSATSLTKIT